MRTSLTALVIGVLATASCSGGSDPVNVTTIPEADLKIELIDFRFAPDSWAFPEGTAVVIDQVNRGSDTHNWTVLSSPISTEAEFDDSLAIFTVEVNPDAQTRVTFDVPPAGTYQVICSIPTHFSEGMVGTLTVEAG